MLTAAAAGFIVVLAIGPIRTASAIKRIVYGEASVASRIRQYGTAAESRLAPRFAAANVAYPPKSIVLVGLKKERELILLAGNDEPLREIDRYRILGASGGPGPKLRRGDQQVPEGFYRIESLNPNSAFHLSLRVDYPNAEDRAAADGRTDLGGDIMIHGGNASVGCLAMGDPAIEELFVLAAKTGLDRIEVVLVPNGSPRTTLPADARLADLYARLASRLASLGISPPS